MKKYIINLILIISIINLIPIVSESASLEDTNVIINGQSIKFTLPPKNIDGNIMLPLRELFELFGFQVNWDKNTKSITILKKDKTIFLKDAELIATVNKNQITQKIPLKLVNGSYYASTEIFQSGLDINIKYNKEENTLYLTNKESYDISISGDNNLVIRGNNLIANITSQSSHDKTNKKIAEAGKLFENRNYLGAIKIYNDILKSISSTNNPEEYAQVMISLANTYIELACVINKEENSLKAIALFDDVIKKIKDDKYSFYRAAAYKGMGNAYLLAAKVRDMEKTSPKALNALNEAIKIYKKEKYPLEYADTQYYVAIVYINLSFSKDGDEYLLKALDACDNALSAYKIKNDTKGYAMIKYCQGMIFESMFCINNDEDYLTKSFDSFNEALKTITIKSDPNTYAYIKMCIGQLYQYLDYKEPSSGHLDSAIKCYNDALEVLTVSKNPFGYANAQEQLGTVYLQNISEENCPKAVSAFKESLKVLTPEEYPLNYAMIQSEIGMAYRYLAAYKKSEEYYTKAIDSFNNALSVFSLEKYPDNHAKAMIELGATYLVEKSKFSVDDIKKAIDCFNVALNVYTPNYNRILYGYAYLNLANAYKILAEKNIDKKENSLNIINAANKASEILTFDYFPKYYLYAQTIIGKAYCFLSEIENKEENLKLAIHYFDEALKNFTQNDFPDEFNDITNLREQARMALIQAK